MAKITLQTLGRKITEKRGARGVREASKEIGISHGTLSRLERGFLPDLETFKRVCQWLPIDPAEVLGVTTQNRAVPRAAVHCRKDQVLAPATAQALAQLILAAHRAVMLMESSEQE
jgi:transcriptional regulator with XRE-family HTH domain